MRQFCQIAGQFKWFLSGSVFFCLMISSSVQAQIVRDHTLNHRSRIERQGNTTEIKGGTQAGENLFHSFRQFNIREGQTVQFDPPTDIENIFTRVTGDRPSAIRGTLEVLGDANFFLLNPNGIIFGRHASLNIGGSFLASTAERLNFQRGSFSTSDTESLPLLRVNVPVGLQFGQTPGAIRNESRSNPVRDAAGSLVAVDGLLAAPGRTLALVGGPVTMPGGIITAAGGRVELGSVTDSGSVSLLPTNQGWRLGYGAVQNFQDIQLRGAAIDVSTEESSGLGGGSVQLQGRTINLTNGSSIFSDTVEQNGREILIRATQLNLDQGAAIGTNTFGSGRGGDITIRAARLNLDHLALVNTNTFSARRGGNITVTVDRLSAQGGGELTTLTDDRGRGGNLTVTASNAIELTGWGNASADPETLDLRPTGLFAQAGENAQPPARAGTLAISAHQLQASEGAQISTSTFGAGDAGRMQVQTTVLSLAGIVRQPNGEPVQGEDKRVFPTGLFTDTDSQVSGNGADLEINTERLSLRGGAVLQTNTEGSGHAGNLTIHAADFVEAIGTAGEGLVPTTLFAASGGIPELTGGGVSDATGRGGSLRIYTRALRVEDGARVAVSSRNPNSAAQGAGNLEIQAETVLLDNGGQLTAATASGNGGDVTLQLQDGLVLRHGSGISTTAGTASAGGNGGNVAINVPDGFIVAVPFENSDIVANAFSGSGGNIRINTRSSFGLVSRSREELEQLLGTDEPDKLDPAQLPSNDITAISQTNPSLSGQITINTLDVDLTRGLVQLPTAPASPEPSQGCQVRGGQTTAEFFNTGRGGLPPSPYEPLSNSDILDDVRLPVEATVPADASAASVRSSEAASSEQIVEAQGWRVDEKGKVTLMAEMPAIAQSHCHLR